MKGVGRGEDGLNWEESLLYTMQCRTHVACVSSSVFYKNILFGPKVIQVEHRTWTV